MIGKDVDAFMPEGLEEELASLPQDTGRRGRSKPRRGRSEDERPKAQSDARRDDSESEAPKRSRGRRRDKSDRDELLEPAGSGPIVGFGEDVPAFLKR